MNEPITKVECNTTIATSNMELIIESEILYARFDVNGKNDTKVHLWRYGSKKYLGFIREIGFLLAE